MSHMIMWYTNITKEPALKWCLLPSSQVKGTPQVSTYEFISYEFTFMQLLNSLKQ